MPRPTLDWFLAACAGTVVAVAGVVAQVRLIDGGAADVASWPGPFYLEARAVVFDVEGHGGGPAVSNVRWWSGDATHGRVEYETTAPPLEAGVSTIAGDGRRLWYHDSRRNTYSVMAIPAQPGEAPPFFPLFSSLLVGPLPFPTIEDLVAALSEWELSSGRETRSATPRGGQATGGGAPATPTPVPAGKVTIAEGERILGRRTVLITTPGGTKLWVDPEARFILRNERRGGPEGTDYWVEVTVLRLGDVDAGLFRFAPPAGAIEAPESSSVTASGSVGPTGRRVTVPSGFLHPGEILAGYSVVSQSQGVDSSGPFSVEVALAEGRAEDAPFLRIEQRKRVDFPVGLQEGRRVTVRGREGWLDGAGGFTTLAWYEDGLAVLLTASALSGEELIEFAEEMSWVP